MARTDHVENLTVDEVSTWLAAHGFKSFIKRFVDEDIDGAALVLLTNDDLKDLIPNIGPRVRFRALLHSVKENKGSESNQPGSDHLDQLESDHLPEPYHLTSPPACLDGKSRAQVLDVTEDENKQSSQTVMVQQLIGVMGTTEKMNDSRTGSLEDLLATVEEEKTESVPEGVDDVDAENMPEVVQVALYVNDIFHYYKERELMFHVEPYLPHRKMITASMRAILVDWLVEVQENFELNHETLYLAVKLVDMYVSHKDIAKEILQLVGAAALFIASKFDERCPPLVEDFLYICDDAYKRREFLAMERTILKTIGFDLGMPLSYRFLRRYAKCCRASMETLTLARYILEMSLMEYEFINKKESEMASAALCLALRMKKAGDWTKTLEYYTGYKESALMTIAKKLNTYIQSSPKQLTTIKSKYSHKVFYEVAKIPTLCDADFI